MFCRLCLIECSKESALPIFAQDDEYNWIHLIAKYLYVQIKENENRCTSICQDCLKHLKEFHKFCEYIKERQLSISPNPETDEILTTIKTEAMDRFTDYTNIKNEGLSDDENMDNFQTINQTSDDDEEMDNCQVLNEAIVKGNKDYFELIKAETVKLKAQQKKITTTLNLILKQNEKITNSVVENNMLLKKSLGLSNKNIENLFPLKNEKSLQVIEKKLQSDKKHEVISVIRALLKSNLKNNLSLVFDEELILSHNFDGLKGKMALKNFKNLIDAIFEASGVNIKNDFIIEIKAALKTHKNRIRKAVSRRSEQLLNEIENEMKSNVLKS